MTTSAGRVQLALILALGAVASSAGMARAMDHARVEARVDSAAAVFGVTGRNVVVGIIDRGIDWKNADFRNPDGTTRIAAIFDLTDDTGANYPNNSYGIGTIYERATIDSALRGQIPPLTTRDAVGHGTTTAGIMAGGGRNSPAQKYRGVAFNATLIVVKFVAGAPAHDSIPAEPDFYDATRLPTAIGFVKTRSAALHMPCVVLPNLGSNGGPTDGTSGIDSFINSNFGAGIQGAVFVNGTGDDGSMPNHAAGDVPNGGTVAIDIQKNDSSSLFFDLWYPGGDQFDVTLGTPDGTFGPYASPPTNGDYDYETPPGVVYYQLGSDLDFFNATDGKREIWIRFDGPVGAYTVTLDGSSVTSGGHFDASLNPSRTGVDNRFTSFVVPGYSLNDFASATHAVVDNDYVDRVSWVDIDGFARSNPGEVVGALWAGSSVGPTYDGRLGVDVSAPGDNLFTTYAPQSYWATFRFNLIQDGAGLYGRASAVSAANPFITGVIALMLEKNPHLDAAQVKQILQASARADAFTGAVPNSNWGYGKLNAFAALQRVVQTVAAPPRPTVARVALALAGSNPFHARAALDYSLPRATPVSLEIVDVTGRKVETLARGVQLAGDHRAEWRPAPLASGVFFAVLRADGVTATKRLLLLR